jgi:glycosyltransferase involved in cell wall biosynthesis
MESKTPLISVIVPVYKVEDYLDRCVQSILSQTYRNLEILLVDDGSPDGCGAMCDAFAKQDDRVKVIHKPNGGLSDARNVAIDVVKGEYLGFVDSDDFIHPKMYESLLNAIRESNASISACFYRSFKPGEDCFSSDEQPETVVFGQKEALEHFYSFNCVNFTLVWNKLYEKSLFEGIRYPKGKTREDEFTTYKLVYKAEKLAFLKDHLYFYLLRPGSIMREKSLANELNYADAQEERQAFFLEHGLAELHQKALLKYLVWLFAMEYKYGKDEQAGDFIQELSTRREKQLYRFQQGKKPGLFLGGSGLLKPLAAWLAFRRIYRNDAIAAWLLGDPLLKNDL